MKWGLPRSLFGRTAMLIAVILCIFSVIVYEAVMWSVVVPSADLTAEVLAQRAQAARVAQKNDASPPDGASWLLSTPLDLRPRFRGFVYGAYLDRLCTGVRLRLHATDVRVAHARAPAQLAIRFDGADQPWLLLSIRLARPETPLTLVAVVSITIVLVLSVSAWSTRRLTRPLARLATAASRIAQGELAQPIPASGPSEVRALAFAFESMSHRLAALNEERELMLAGISHDLRSPLARIRVALELLEGGNPDLLQQMSAEIQEVDRMIGIFLHYVRAGYRETPVVAVFDEVVRGALTPFASDERISFEWSAPGTRLLHVDALAHIAFNLVQNALEHGQPPVRVCTRADIAQVWLEIRDAGSGIGPEDWQAALRPFSRLRAAPGQGHAGLGLALVDRLVRATRGRLVAQRSPDGFRIEVGWSADAVVNQQRPPGACA